MNTNTSPSQKDDDNIHHDFEEPEVLSEAEIKDRKENKDTAAASYFLILSPLLLFTRKDSEFIQFHASQALILLLFFIVLWILGGILGIFKWFIVVIIFAAIVGFVQAIQGEKYQIPFIYEMVKDGISGKKIIEQLKKATLTLWNMGKGLMPKNISDKIDLKTDALGITKSSTGIEKRIEELEFLGAENKYAQCTLKINSLKESDEQKIKDFLQIFLEIDKNAKLQTLTKSYKVEGTFGTIKIFQTKEGKIIVIGCKKNIQSHMEIQEIIGNIGIGELV